MCGRQPVPGEALRLGQVEWVQKGSQVWVLSLGLS